MIKKRLVEAQEKLADARRGREEDEDGGERVQKLARLEELAKEKTTLQSELEKLKDLDPTVIADLEKELNLVKQAAHRWTENIFTVRFIQPRFLFPVFIIFLFYFPSS